MAWCAGGASIFSASSRSASASTIRSARECPSAQRGLAVFDQRIQLRQNTDGARGAECDSDQRNERLEHHQQLGPSG